MLTKYAFQEPLDHPRPNHYGDHGIMIQSKCSHRALFCCLAVAALFAANDGTPGYAETRHRVTIDDFDTLRSVELMDISPNGQFLAYSTWQKDLWVVATDHNGVPRKLGQGTFPLWSPNGKYLAYYSTSSGSLQLWIMDVVSEKSEQVTQLHDGINPDPSSRLSGWTFEPFRYSWSPDSKKLVFSSRVAVQVPATIESSPTLIPTDQPIVLNSTTPAGWTLDGLLLGKLTGEQKQKSQAQNSETPRATRLHLPAMVSQLFINDIDSKLSTQLTEDTNVYFSPDWSPDGRRIACVSSEGKVLAADGSVKFPPTNIYVVDLATGVKTPLTSGAGERRVPRWSPDGKWVAYLNSEEFGMHSIFVVSATGGAPINASSKLERSVMSFNWFPDGASLMALVIDGVSWPVLRVEFPSGRFTRLSGDADGYRDAAVVSHSGSVGWDESTGSTSGVIRVRAPQAATSDVVVELNPQLREWEMGEQDVFRWRNARGDSLEGVLIKPVGYQKGKRYPLIVDCYPGMSNGLLAGAMNGNHAWAAKGYVVFYPDPRAPHVWMNSFKNPSFYQAAKGPKGWSVTIDDVMSGVDELIRQGMVDSSRMGLYGFSNGGGVVNYLVGKTNRFKCAVSVAGALSDWVRPFLLHTDDKVVATWAGIVNPWDDFAGLMEMSAVYHTNNVTTPILLADGDDDGDFLLDTIEMFNGLRWFGKDVTLLRYPGQGHGFTGAALKDFWVRENTFFDKYLKPEQPPH